jgi:large subunit ribosomal protein L19
MLLNNYFICLFLGCEVCFHLYDPTLLSVDVLKLEKRLDEELLYLRDALPEYSTFPLDMEPQHLPEGTPVPVNTTKVSYTKLN